MFDEFTRRVGHFPEVITGKPLALGGSLGREAATGRGALFCLDYLVHRDERSAKDTRVAVQGFGNAGSWFAQLAHEMGYRIVAVSDSKGAVVNQDGLEPHMVLTHKRETGSVVDFYAGDTMECEEIFATDTDVLVPAALSDALIGPNVEFVKASYVLEVANHPVSPGADHALAARGVKVVPDILASAGGVVVSYLEWAQNMQHEQWREKRVNARLKEMMEDATEAVATRAERDDITMRQAAYDIAVDRVAEAERARGYL
jgi:glutamate dehydrogenase/leucine dehydrogenase